MAERVDAQFQDSVFNTGVRGKSWSTGKRKHAGFESLLLQILLMQKKR